MLDSGFMLYEHKSTANPNLPLRDLFYVSRVLDRRTKDQNLYGSAIVRIPAPRFVVFYNGTDYCPEKQVLKLSDAFEKKQDIPEIELTVTVYNINLNNNSGLMNACRVLREYAEYVELVRTLAKEMPFPEAVEQAVDYCIQNGILRDFLSENRAEAIAMSIFEYDEEQHLKSEREQAYRDGKEEGIEEGKREGIAVGHQQGIREGIAEGEDRLAKLLQLLSAAGRAEDLHRAIEEPSYREQLYEEMHL